MVKRISDAVVAKRKKEIAKNIIYYIFPFFCKVYIINHRRHPVRTEPGWYRATWQPLAARQKWTKLFSSFFLFGCCCPAQFSDFDQIVEFQAYFRLFQKISYLGYLFISDMKCTKMFVHIWGCKLKVIMIILLDKELLLKNCWCMNL